MMLTGHKKIARKKTYLVTIKSAWTALETNHSLPLGNHIITTLPHSSRSSKCQPSKFLYEIPVQPFLLHLQPIVLCFHCPRNTRIFKRVLKKILVLKAERKSKQKTRVKIRISHKYQQVQHVVPYRHVAFHIHMCYKNRDSLHSEFKFAS